MNDLLFFGIDLLQNRQVGSQDTVMFDIDDTLIYQTLGPAYRPMKEMIMLANEAKVLGYKVLIMTARPHYKENVEATIQQLNELNIDYDILAFVPAEHKGSAKKKFGYNFVLSVGDLETDLTETDYFINTRTKEYGSSH